MKPNCLVLTLIGLVLICSGNSFGSTNSVVGNAPSVQPQTFSLSWNTAPNFEHRSVQWDGKALKYQFNRDKEESITPSQADWTKFWIAMDKVKVWEWQDRYINRDLTDGLAWSVELQHGTNEVKVFGRNGYPKDGSPKELSKVPSKLYFAYQKAVEELIGRKLWKE